MIKGLGVDIIEIDRIKKSAQNKHFLVRCFTQKEIKLFEAKGNRAETIAANFAAKEAVSKALGTGFSGFSPADIEVLRNDKNAPYVILHGGAKIISDKLNIHTILISISHSEAYAVATAIVQ